MEWSDENSTIGMGQGTCDTDARRGALPPAPDLVVWWNLAAGTAPTRCCVCESHRPSSAFWACPGSQLNRTLNALAPRLRPMTGDVGGGRSLAPGAGCDRGV